MVSPDKVESAYEATAGPPQLGPRKTESVAEDVSSRPEAACKSPKAKLFAKGSQAEDRKPVPSVPYAPFETYE